MLRPPPTYLPCPDADAVVAAAHALSRAPGDVVCVMAAEREAPDVHDLARELRAGGVSAFGGLFPGVVHEGHVYRTGVVLHAFPALGPPTLACGLRRPYRFPQRPSLHAQGTALVFLTGGAPKASRFLHDLFGWLGAACRYVGAGSHSCVFADGVVAAEGAVVALLDLDAAFEAAHGHRRVGAPLIVTRADHNVVHELNWEPAVGVLTAELARAPAATDGGPPPAATAGGVVGVPLGLHKEGREPLVREVVGETAGGGLVCVGEVPENAVLNLLAPGPPPEAPGAPEALGHALGTSPSWYWAAASAARFGSRGGGEALEAWTRPYQTPEGLRPFGVLSQAEVAYGGCGCLELTGRTLTIGALACRSPAPGTNGAAARRTSYRP